MKTALNNEDRSLLESGLTQRLYFSLLLTSLWLLLICGVNKIVCQDYCTRQTYEQRNPLNSYQNAASLGFFLLSGTIRPQTCPNYLNESHLHVNYITFGSSLVQYNSFLGVHVTCFVFVECWIWYQATLLYLKWITWPDLILCLCCAHYK